MKKAISLVLVLMMLIGMLPVSALAAEGSIAVSNALAFSGADDQYACEAPLGAAPLSFEAVIQLDPDYSERAGVIASNFYQTGTYAYQTVLFSFELSTNGNPRLYWYQANSGQVKTEQSTVFKNVDVRSEDFVHLAITFDPATDTAVCYLNGEAKQTVTGLQFEPVAPVTPLRIGGDYRSSGSDSTDSGYNKQYFKGQIANVSIFSDVLTGETVAQHYQNLCADAHNVPQAQDNLLGSWDFTAAVDGVYADLSGKGNDVTAFSDWVDGAPSQGDYTMVVLPDPKTLVGSNPDQYTASIDWILENQASRNIEAVLTMGDLTPNNGTDAQWEVITGSVNRLLEAGIPTMPMMGNTDNADKFNANFAYASFAEQEWFGGSFEEGKLDHAYWYVTVGEWDYLVLSLGWEPTTDVLDWAEEVVRTHPYHSVIITSHAYMNVDNTLLEAGDKDALDAEFANGKDIWDRLSAYDNVVLGMGGHIGSADVARWYGTNGAGETVASLLACAAPIEKYNLGMVMVLTFHEDSNTVDVNWYSTGREQLFRERNQFSIEVPHVEKPSFTALSFSGVDDQYACEEPLSEAPLTFEAMIQLDEDYSKRAGVIASNFYETGYWAYRTYQVSFEVYSNGNPRLYWYQGNASQEKDQLSAIFDKVDIRSKDFVHVAITFDPAAGSATCYVNGEAKQTITGLTFAPQAPTTPLKIGGDYRKSGADSTNTSYNAQYFKGQIASVSAYSDILTADIIAQHSQAISEDIHAVPRTGDGLLASWDLTAGVDGVYADLTGKGNDVYTFADWLEPELSEGDYTMVVLPDTQTLVETWPDVYSDMLDWILENQASRNIQAVIGLGDMTDDNNTTQWETAAAGHDRLLQAGLPAMPMRGNHDNSDSFNASFSYEEYASQDWFGGSFEEGKLDNTYWYVTSGDRDYLILSLGWSPSFDVLNWAEEVVRTHPNHNVIVTAHAYMNGDNTLLEAGDMAQVTSGCANGKDIWEQLGRYSNVVLAMGGHIGNPDIARWYDANGAGETVSSLLADAQYMEYQFGMGMVMLLTFHEDSDTVDVNWYSTQRDQMFRARNQFSIDVPHVEKSDFTALSFTGADDQYACEEPLDEAPLTFEAVIQLDPAYTKRAGVIAGNYYTSGYWAYRTVTVSFEIRANGNPCVYWNQFNAGLDPDEEWFTFTNVDVRSSEFVHLAVTIDPENGTATCYLNGEAKETLTDLEFKPQAPTLPLKIGGDYRYSGSDSSNKNYNAQYFKGQIASVSIFSRELTAEEVAQHHQASAADVHDVPKAQDGLLASWDFTAAVDGVYADLSGKGNDVYTFADWLDEDLSEGDYSIVVLPDTQNLVESKTDVHSAMIDWILENRTARNIQAVIGLGDMTDDNNATQWETAAAGHDRLLQAGLPAMPMRGNHDNSASFNSYFDYDDYASQEWFGGSFEEGKLDNTYWYVSAGDRNYLVLSLGWSPSFEVLDWAEEVVRTHPAHNVIVTAHAYMNGDNTLLEAGDMAEVTSGCANGKDIWERLGAYENVVLAMGGHIGNPDIARWYGTNGADKVVASLLADAQYMESQFGMGMVMVLTFHEDSDTVDINWYSTQRDQLFRERNQFSIEVPHVIHTHSYTAVVTDPTCTAKGYTTYTCQCGDSYAGDHTDALDHTWSEWEQAKAPTTLELGEESRICSVCEEEENRDVARLRFEDVPEGAYYEAAVDWAVEQKITAGTTDTTFEPEAPCTRAQVVTFLWRAAGEPEAEGENPFSDVTETEYYYEAVLWAVSEGITQGSSATTFEPEAPCTRAQIVTFLHRFAGEPEAQIEDPFIDLAEGEYYIPAVLWAVENGITRGDGAENTFNPEGVCQRCQIVTFLYRFLAE